MRVGQARRRDTVEADIIRELRQIGAHVTPISGRGAPDLLVRYGSKLFAFEVKSPGGKRTLAQAVSQWTIVRTPEEALRALIPPSPIDRFFDGPAKRRR